MGCTREWKATQCSTEQVNELVKRQKKRGESNGTPTLGSRHTKVVSSSRSVVCCVYINRPSFSEMAETGRVGGSPSQVNNDVKWRWPTGWCGRRKRGLLLPPVCVCHILGSRRTCEKFRAILRQHNIFLQGKWKQLLSSSWKYYCTATRRRLLRWAVVCVDCTFFNNAMHTARRDRDRQENKLNLTAATMRLGTRTNNFQRAQLLQNLTGQQKALLSQSRWHSQSFLLNECPIYPLYADYMPFSHEGHWGNQ